MARRIAPGEQFHPQEARHRQRCRRGLDTRQAAHSYLPAPSREVRSDLPGEASENEEIVGTEVVEALANPGELFRMQGLGTLAA